MNSLFSFDWIIIPLIGLCVFLFAYLHTDKVLFWLHKRSLGQREEILKLLDLMFVEASHKKVTTILLLLSFGLGALAFLALWPNVVAGIIFGILFVIMGWSVPKLVMTALYEKRCNRFVNQMVDGMTIMANGVSSGLSVTQSMERVTDNMSNPIKQEFNLVLSQIRIGMSIEEALIELSERIPRPDVQMFVNSINILKETGGNLGETFSTINNTIRERQKIEKKIQALTAQGIAQGVIITLVPFFLLLVLFAIQPQYIMPMFTTTLGVILLLVMLILQAIGGFAIKKIITIKV